MKHLSSLVTIVLTLSLTCALSLSAVLVTIVEDDFDSSHTYFDGTDIDIAGTQWDGLYGTQWLSAATANSPTSSWLAYVLTTNEDTSIVNVDYYPKLYKIVDGDFIADMKIGGTIPIDAWITFLIMCGDQAGNYSGWGSFGAIGSSYGARMQNYVRNLEYTPGTNVVNWYRMARANKTFTFYQRPTDTGEWYHIGSFINTLVPKQAYVGPIVATHTPGLGGSYFVDYFSIAQSTGTASLAISPVTYTADLIFGNSTNITVTLSNTGEKADWNVADGFTPYLTITPDHGTIDTNQSVQLSVEIIGALPKGLNTIPIVFENNGLANPKLTLNITVAPAGGVISVVDDDFDDDHVYYDGTDVDVDGTQWDGVWGSGYLSSMEANNPSDSFLKVQINLNAEPTSIGNTPAEYRFPVLYKDVTGDFEAEMKFVNPIGEAYIINFIVCADFALSNDYLAGCFPIAPVWGFWDYQAAHTDGSRTLDAGVGPYTGTNQYYKISRLGNTFNAYSRPNVASNWLNFATYVPSVTYPGTLSVGLSVAEHVLLGYTYFYDYFKITQTGPTPGQFMVLPNDILVPATATETPVQLSAPMANAISVQVLQGAAWLSAPADVNLDNNFTNIMLTLTAPPEGATGIVQFTSADDPANPQTVTVAVQVPEPTLIIVLVTGLAFLSRKR